MGKVYSDDIRLRVTGLVSDGASRRAAARRLVSSCVDGPVSASTKFE